LQTGAPVNALASTADGALLAGDADGTVRLWRPGSAAARILRQRGGAAVDSVAVTPDGRLAVAGDADGAVRIWDLRGRRAPIVLRKHTGPVTAVAVSPDGRFVASGAGPLDFTVRLWD